MKVLYDSQIFGSQKYGGISRYFVELIKELELLENYTSILPFIYSQNAYLDESRLSKSKIFIPILDMKFRGNYRVHNMLLETNSLLEKRKIRNGDYDIFHPTYYEPKLLPDRNPLVLTVHDLIHELFPSYFTNVDSFLQKKKLIIQKADHIIAVSHTTKRDLLEYYKVRPEKVSVVYHASSLMQYKSEDIKVEFPFILFVGARGGYKNFQTLLEAFVKINTELELNLICAGGGPFNSKEMNFINKNGITNKIFQKSPSNEQLRNLYEKAFCLVVPSLYEGFGIPIVEAYSLNCVVACSDIDVFREICDKHTHFFDPYSSDAIANTVLSLSGNNKSSIGSEGGGGKQLFSWSVAAEKTMEVYKKIIVP